MSICGHEEVWKSPVLNRVQAFHARDYKGPRQNVRNENKNKQTKTQSPHWTEATSLLGRQSTARCCLLASDSRVRKTNMLLEGKNWALSCVRRCYQCPSLLTPRAP